MRTNDVKQKIQRGEVSLGTFVFEFNSTGIARLAAGAGAEFIVFDMEHTGWSVQTIRELVASTPKATVPMVRVPAVDYHFVARVLDVGAMGIMVPMVEDAHQAGQLVRAAKYPPVGRRGAAFGVAHDDYQGGDILATMKSANDQQVLIAQIETAKGLENVDEIAAVDGVDVLWVGHFDLTNSLGIPGQFEHPEFFAAVKKVSEACRKHGKVGGFMSSDPDNARWLLSEGYRMQALGGDLWLYQQALAEGLAAVRKGLD